jgi:hypothetical protein
VRKPQRETKPREDENHDRAQSLSRNHPALKSVEKIHDPTSTPNLGYHPKNLGQVKLCVGATMNVQPLNVGKGGPPPVEDRTDVLETGTVVAAKVSYANWGDPTRRSNRSRGIICLSAWGTNLNRVVSFRYCDRDKTVSNSTYQENAPLQTARRPWPACRPSAR